MKTLVIGATENPQRYSHLAVERLREFNHEVVALGLKEGSIGDVKIFKGQPAFENIHTVTLYINPSRQPQLYDYILGLKPKRVIFNPGTENEEFESLLNKAGIETMEACTLVLLSINAYSA
jgi:predicted CoA-binding protein